MDSGESKKALYSSYGLVLEENSSHVFPKLLFISLTSVVKHYLQASNIFQIFLEKDFKSFMLNYPLKYALVSSSYMMSDQIQ